MLELTPEQVTELFEYRDGDLYWKLSTNHKIAKDKKAGTKNSHGYLTVTLNDKILKVHRLVFLLHYGYLPKYIDHINGNRSDNRIENLREATASQNCLNRSVQSNNKANIKNVSWHKRDKKWQVFVTVDKKSKYFGSFKDLELADLVAQEARDKFHKEYANHG
jgi:hypothetical protein